MKIFLSLILICTSSLLLSQTATPINDSIVSGGVYRHFTLYVPAIYNPASAVPLIFNNHGASGSGDQQMAFGDFRPIADTANFIVVHPTAIKQKGFIPLKSVPLWNSNVCFETDYDRQFLFDLLDTIKQRYNIDTNRIYSTGFSQGGQMSYNFACYNNFKFAAIAPVATGMSYMIFDLCTPLRPTPVLIIKGTDDGYDGKSGNVMRTDTDSAVAYWVAVNNCDTPYTYHSILPDLVDTDSSTVEHFVWTGGDQGATVELYKIHNGGHAWPAIVNTGGTVSPDGGNSMIIGFRNMDFNAANEIWRFFRQHSLATATSVSVTPTPCPTTSINDHESDNNGVVAFPNPSDGKFTIQVEDKTTTELIITNVLGDVVYRAKIDNAIIKFDLHDKPRGVYFYQLFDIRGVLKNSGKLVMN